MEKEITSSNKKLSMARSKAELKVLFDAYDVCWTMNEHCNNVLAGSEEKDLTDLEMQAKSKRFIDWYQKNIIATCQDQKLRT